MRRKIPSTAALSAFESAARHQSFTKAADELAVTQSAVCRQIGALEEFLDLKLFRRGRRGVALTEAGLIYSRQISARLNEVERDTLALMAKGGQGGTLELGVVPTFATKWLLPRMPLFAAEHPDITVNLSARTRPFLFDETTFDAAIYAGPATWPGTDSLFLMRENLIAVCSPALGRIDWRRHALLQQSTRPYAWRDWFTSRGLQVEGDMSGPRFELFSMLAEAAIHGMGVALIPRFLVEDELRRGVLVQAVSHQYLNERSYYLIYPEGKAGNTALTAFRRWLAGQAGEYSAAMGLD
ncbi:LysR family transcriptional regulator [Duganella sp. BJB488]|uniref:LysR family transcriptional regulator n=1 Tax=unclassified Duganella TaxID=2636909 RepID=UPI000E343AD8|nr:MULTISPECIES: LysR family transcriptional regulator [unclassified Duganella]RFP09281.1 LysR family transcriptional regulator [Duganella sp. BJB475]RFP13170.1 LysR family transcriptional regulator [Duganella sp. BJB489]RFP17228.1 LysR family transcriptional regulator [Duganella sp. BJB488]RFP25316.1 LysR family transcriptional regulator [Duganella sp. BJB476]RFP31524.1 LysR family transcriptional regulator [Duganella sp. BJB480]